METKHYKIENFAEFSNDTETIAKLEWYIERIEKIFPVIEVVFGQEWIGGKIQIRLNSGGGTNYGRPDGIHTITINLRDEIIQSKKYPENLWGCLLHEMLHAFMSPVIYRKGGNTNDLDEFYWDKFRKEPFIFAFQNLVYGRLKEENVIDEILYEKFLRNLRDEIGEAEILYNHYIDLFSTKSDYFSNFIKLLSSSEEPLIKKGSFWTDLERVEGELRE